MGLFSIQLHDEEEMLAIVRRHVLTFSWTIIRFAIIIAVAASIYYFFPPSQWTIIVSLALGVAAVFFLFYNFIVWYLVSIVITSERVIDIHQTGLTRRVVTEVSLEDISQAIALKEGLWQHICNMGTLIIEVKEGGKVVCFGVKDPENLMSQLNRLRRQSS